MRINTIGLAIFGVVALGLCASAQVFIDDRYECAQALDKPLDQIQSGSNSDGGCKVSCRLNSGRTITATIRDGHVCKDDSRKICQSGTCVTSSSSSATVVGPSSASSSSGPSLVSSPQQSNAQLGKLRVTIVGGHVPQMDGRFGQGDTDAFVRGYLNSTKNKFCETPTAKDTKDPVWNFECPPQFDVHRHTDLLFEVHDSDKYLGGSEFIGRFNIDLADYQNKSWTNGSNVRIPFTANKKTNRYYIILKIRYIPN